MKSESGNAATKNNDDYCSCRGHCCSRRVWPSETKMRMAKIEKVAEEYSGNKTFYMAGEMEFAPGQFAMAWLPGVDEKPLALIPNGKKFAFNIEGKGEATKKMLELKAGAMLGVRGPYGDGFSIAGVKRAAVIAGGTGIASVIKLAHELKSQKCRTKIIIGGRTKERAIFRKELEKFGDVLVATDDGSLGEKGFNVRILERLLGKEKFDCVYACGPEAMIAKALEISLAKKVRFEASLERYMKCGIGVCGQCVLDDKLVCRDGPVFSGKELSKSREFNRFAYIKSGKRVSLKEYFEWQQV